MEQRVSISISDGIADVRLVRADKMNALDAAMFDAIVAATERLAHEKGLGEIASSWVSSGQNLPISEDQIHQMLGSPMVQQIAASCGISPQDASSKLAQFLPMIVDHLTPQGKVA